MADKNIVKQTKANRRRRRVRAKINGTPECPRLTVCKSLKNTFVQVIDDVNRVTLVGTATNAKAVRDQMEKGSNKTKQAYKVGEVIAAMAKEKGIEQVVFDRNVSGYTGRVKAVADGAREGGLKF